MSSGKGTVNRVIIIGNFGADPELRTLPDGGSVTNFNVATTEVWSDKNNPKEKHEQTEWHRVTFFGRQAEVLHEYGRKGNKIYIEGSLRTRKWTDKEGIERYTTEVRGREFTFLSSQRDSQQQRHGDYQGGGGGKGGGGQDSSDAFSSMDDDNIPF